MKSKLSAVVVLFLAFIFLFSFSSCVSQETYQNAILRLNSVQGQMQITQSELTKTQEQNQSFQKELDDVKAQKQNLQTNLTKAQEQNQSVQKELDHAKEQTKTLQTELKTIQGRLDTAQTQAKSLEKATAYADFLYLLLNEGWRELNIPSDYKFPSVEEYGLAIIQKATKLNDSVVDQWVNDIAHYYISKSESKITTATVQLMHHCLKKIKDFSVLAEVESSVFAASAELSTIQTAMDAMMADRSLTTVTAVTTGISDMTKFPHISQKSGETSLFPDYLRTTTSHGTYTADAYGNVSQVSYP